MNTAKYLLIPTMATSLLVLAGCTAQTSTNTNLVANTNTTNDNANVEVVTNTNETVDNENTNNINESGEVDLSTGAFAEVDTSDPALNEVEGWLTYTNEEYGFSFRYPKSWSVGTNGNNIGCVSDLSIVCDTYSYGEGSFDDFPVEYVYGKIYVEEFESFSTMTDEEILMTAPGKEVMPLVDEEFLTVNKLPAYRSLRQLKKGELLRPTAQDSTERIEQTSTEIEYRYFHNNNLIRLTLSIQGDSYQNYYDVIDVIGQSFSI